MARGERSIDESGATAVEYALLIGLIAIVIFAAVAALGTQVFALYDVQWW